MVSYQTPVAGHRSATLDQSSVDVLGHPGRQPGRDSHGGLGLGILAFLYPLLLFDPDELDLCPRRASLARPGQPDQGGARGDEAEKDIQVALDLQVPYHLLAHYPD